MPDQLNSYVKRTKINRKRGPDRPIRKNSSHLNKQQRKIEKDEGYGFRVPVEEAAAFSHVWFEAGSNFGRINAELENEGDGAEDERCADGVRRKRDQLFPPSVIVVALTDVPAAGFGEAAEDFVRQDVHPEESMQEAELKIISNLEFFLKCLRQFVKLLNRLKIIIF